MDGSLPGSSVHGIFQVRILEWVAIFFSRGSSCPEIESASAALQAGSSSLCLLAAVLTQSDFQMFMSHPVLRN